MATLFSIDTQSNVSSQSLLLNTETVVAQGKFTSVPTGSVKAAITAFFQWNFGSSCTTAEFRIRRGTTVTDPQVGLITYTPDARTPLFSGVQIVPFTEVLTNVSGAQYCLTVKVNGDVGTVQPTYIETQVTSG